MKNKYQKNKKRGWSFLSVLIFGLVFWGQNIWLTLPVEAQAEDLAITGDNKSQETMMTTNSSLSSDVSGAVKGILNLIFQLIGWMISIGATLLGWTLSPELWGKGGFLDKGVVYDTWSIFRDLFNMAFILMLLYSAFATIFQADRFNIKNTYVSFLLAILLINFSYPIARIIIDISNVTMFSFLNDSSGLVIASDFMNFTKIEGVLLPGGYAKSSIPFLLAAIIFVFILGVTLVTIGVLMVVRLFALMILVMSAPVGFVGSVFPGMSGFSSKWWNALYNYSFFGPIMVFVLILANSIMADIGNDARNQLINSANSTSMDGELINWIAHAAYYFLPVVLIWIGMGVARNMSIWGADKVVGKAQGFSKWVGNLPKRGAKAVFWTGTGAAGAHMAAKQEFLKSGKILGRKIPLYGGSDQTSERADRLAGLITDKNPLSGFRDATFEHQRRKAMEIRKQWKDKGGTTDKELQKLLGSNNSHERIAAAMEMAENNGFGKENAVANYNDAMTTLRDHPVQRKIFEDKVGEKHILTKIKAEGGNNDQYVENLKNMNLNKMVKQKGLFADKGVHDYLKQQLNNPETKKETQKLLIAISKDNNISLEDKKALRNSGISM